MRMRDKFSSFYFFPISSSMDRMIDPQIQPESLPSQMVSFRSDAVKGILNLSVTQMDWADATCPLWNPVRWPNLRSSNSPRWRLRWIEQRRPASGFRAKSLTTAPVRVTAQDPPDVVSERVDQTIRQFFPQDPEIKVDIYRFFAYTPHTNLDQAMPQEAQRVGEIHRKLSRLHPGSRLVPDPSRSRDLLAICLYQVPLFPRDHGISRNGPLRTAWCPLALRPFPSQMGLVPDGLPPWLALCLCFDRAYVADEDRKPLILSIMPTSISPQ